VGSKSKKGAYSTPCWLSIIGLVASCIKFLHLEKRLKNAQVIILAAGEAKRFGSPKQLASFKDVSMLEYVIRLALAEGYRPWVALGANRELIQRNCSEVLTKTNVVDVVYWKRGLSESIGKALNELVNSGRVTDGVLILLGDQPWLTKEHIMMMREQAERSPEKIVAADYGGWGGVPAYFPNRYLDGLACLEGDGGAKQLIADCPHVLVDVGDAVRDVDYPDDLRV